MPDYPFYDKVALVTGASSGIGRAAALTLARHGAHLALAARREGRLHDVAREIQALDRRTLVLPADVTDRSQVDALVRSTVEYFGRVDILVSNAGEYVRAPLSTLRVEDIHHSMAINYYGGVYTVLVVLPHMQARRSGHIVLVTSMDGKVGLPLDAPYVSAKFALTGFADVLRQELRGSGIFVSNILPGRVDTDMIAHLRLPWISARISPQAVADAIVRAIRKRQPEVIIPFRARLFYYTSILSPHLGDWIARRFHLEGWYENRG